MTVNLNRTIHTLAYEFVQEIDWSKASNADVSVLAAIPNDSIKELSQNIFKALSESAMELPVKQSLCKTLYFKKLTFLDQNTEKVAKVVFEIFFPDVAIDASEMHKMQRLICGHEWNPYSSAKPCLWGWTPQDYPCLWKLDSNDLENILYLSERLNRPHWMRDTVSILFPDNLCLSRETADRYWGKTEDLLRIAIKTNSKSAAAEMIWVRNKIDKSWSRERIHVPENNHCSCLNQSYDEPCCCDLHGPLEYTAPEKELPSNLSLRSVLSEFNKVRTFPTIKINTTSLKLIQSICPLRNGYKITIDVKDLINLVKKNQAREALQQIQEYALIKHLDLQNCARLTNDISTWLQENAALFTNLEQLTIDNKPATPQDEIAMLGRRLDVNTQDKVHRERKCDINDEIEKANREPQLFLPLLMENTSKSTIIPTKVSPKLLKILAAMDWNKYPFTIFESLENDMANYDISNDLRKPLRDLLAKLPPEKRQLLQTHTLIAKDGSKIEIPRILARYYQIIPKEGSLPVPSLACAQAINAFISFLNGEAMQLNTVEEAKEFLELILSVPDARYFPPYEASLETHFKMVTGLKGVKLRGSSFKDYFLLLSKILKQKDDSAGSPLLEAVLQKLMELDIGFDSKQSLSLWAELLTSESPVVDGLLDLELKAEDSKLSWKWNKKHLLACLPNKDSIDFTNYSAPLSTIEIKTLQSIVHDRELPLAKTVVAAQKQIRFLQAYKIPFNKKALVDRVKSFIHRRVTSAKLTHTYQFLNLPLLMQNLEEAKRLKLTRKDVERCGAHGCTDKGMLDHFGSFLEWPGRVKTLQEQAQEKFLTDMQSEIEEEASPLLEMYKRVSTK